MSTPKEPAQDENDVAEYQKEESKKDGDAESSGASKKEFVDPAILTMSAPAAIPPEYRYQRDVLFKLRQAPKSHRRPDYLDSNYFSEKGFWDPEPWHYDSKDNQAENENPKQRKFGDPRERVRKEQEAIFLSPQRRNFNSGCFVPLQERGRNRAHSPIGKEEGPHLGHRDLNSGPSARRVGSGRLLTFPDYQDKPNSDNDYVYRRDRRDTDRERDDRFDRRSFSRDFDVNKDKERHSSSRPNIRYNNRRISNENKEEEPEWFSSGPTSQNDTIELRGFEEAEKLGNKKKGILKKKQLQLQREQQNSNQQQVKSIIPKEQDVKPVEFMEKKEESTSRSSPTPPVGAKPVGDQPQKLPPKEKETSKGQGQDASFNFEDIFKCDSIPGLLSNGVESSDAAGSRFSRWFTRDKSPPNKEGSRSSSLEEQDHHQILKNLLGDQLNEPSVKIPQPGDSESYFAPISPAASSVPTQQNKSVNLMEMLQRGNKHATHSHNEMPPLNTMKPMGDAGGVPGKILSLEELESRMIQGAEFNKNQNQKTGEDIVKKLFSQMNVNQQMTNGPTSQKAMSLMEMLKHSQQQEDAAREAARLANQRMNATNIAHLKLQQVQSQVQQQQQLEMLTKLISSGMNSQATRVSPLAEMGINQSRELLNRPEAQAILQGLKRGDITPQHLHQQLANQGMQPRHRELLMTILKMQVAGGLSQNNAASPISHPPHHVYQQQLRVSPLPPNPLHQRIPSPRELQVHTQNIMQRALIKKKLEEQEENFRKKQVQQRGTSPAKISSPTPLTFTPTAVLRKMTADKDDASKESKIDGKIPQGRALTGMRQQTIQQPSQVGPLPPQNWNNMYSQLKQPGRPIVKANNNLQQQQQPSQTQTQDQYFQHQRFLQQQRKNQQTFGNNFVTNHNQQQQFPQLSQQQLRAQQQTVRSQHQHQAFPQQPPQSWAQQMLLQNQGFDNRQVGRGGNDGDLSPTSNQLARWFSPNLLERAKKGELPVIPQSAVAQHALSLEEVERQSTPVGHN